MPFTIIRKEGFAKLALHPQPCTMPAHSPSHSAHTLAHTYTRTSTYVNTAVTVVRAVWIPQTAFDVYALL